MVAKTIFLFFLSQSSGQAGKWVQFPEMPELLVPQTILVHSTKEEFFRAVLMRCGPYVQVSQIWNLLGFNTPDAARKAARDHRLGLEAITLPGRRGYYVRAQDLAAWVYAAMSNPEAYNLTKQTTEEAISTAAS